MLDMKVINRTSSYNWFSYNWLVQKTIFYEILGYVDKFLDQRDEFGFMNYNRLLDYFLFLLDKRNFLFPCKMGRRKVNGPKFNKGKKKKFS